MLEMSCRGMNMKVRTLVGSGETIGLFTLPFLVVGVILNILIPSLFSVGGPSIAVQIISLAILVIGVTNWIWSVILILTRVPRNELITTGPFALVKHPLYTGVALLVLPWLGLLFNSWLGVLLGLILYCGSRMFSPEEERTLSRKFGAAWDGYSTSVKLPWL
jgi:protein-S-isoprenylcysteine O-methyltransferase Ste14